MNKLVQSAANSQPARLPAIVIPPGVDPVLRQTLEAIKERLEVRDGARGNPYERGLTVRDLVDAGVDVTLVGQRVTPKPVVRKAPSSGGLGLESGTLPASIEALIRKSLTAEASRLGAHIQRVEHRLQTESESQASVVQQLTAAIGQASAGVRQVSYANATANRSTAGLITQLAAALDGTGSATLEESMVVIADRTEGLRSQYMLKLGAGNAVTGISLLASEDPTGATESAFIVQADRFQVKTAGGTKTPFGIDGSNIYLDGTVRINAGGQTLATLATNAAVPAITYIGEFASAPATATLKKNNVYRNSSNGNTYILSEDAGVWQLYLEKGATGPAGAAGATGQRGSMQFYSNGTPYSDSAATSLVQTVTGSVATPVIGDTVNFTNGSGASATTVTRYWGGSAWLLPGVVINGNLLVGGSIASSSVDTTQYVKAKGMVSNGNVQAAIWGENSTHSGFAVIGLATNALAAGAAYFLSTNFGDAVYAQANTGRGVYGAASSATGIGVSGYNSTGVAVECAGKFRFGSYDYLRPDGSASKFMAADGTWKRPNLSDINPATGDAPGFQFSQDNGLTWANILLRRI